MVTLVQELMYSMGHVTQKHLVNVSIEAIECIVCTKRLMYLLS